MSNKLTFELVQPNEFEDYYYKVSISGNFICYLLFDKEYQWLVQDWNDKKSFGRGILIEVANKINELNAATKADKFFGFL